MAIVFLNGELVDDAAPRIAVDDRGLLLGDGLFETMRAYGGRVFRLAAHLSRLRESATFLRLKIPFADDEIEKAIAELIERNDCSDAYIRLTVTRGASKGLRLDETAPPTVLIRVRPLTSYSEERYRKGVRLVLSTIRQNSASPLPRHKTLNYLPYLLARQEATEVHADGAILLNELGQVTEESVSNIFFVRDGALVTPPVHCGLLPGIMRATVLELARENGIEAKKEVVSAGDLFNYDEAFLTNSLMEIMPVRSVDKRRIRKAVPGSVTKCFQELLQALIAEECG